MTAEQHRAHDEAPTETKIIVLRNATWADYQRLLEMRGDHSAPRISYLEGEIEIRSPSKMHESIKSKIGRLVEVWCLEKGIPFEAAGAWTLEEKAVNRGAEPDECYVFGDLAAAESPDLAIEVVWTSGGLNKLELYRKLGVREIWFWRRAVLTIHVLRGENYQQSQASEVLPGIDLEQLAGHLARPMHEAIRTYREELQRASRG